MILIDTSVWIDHLRTAEPLIAELVRRRNVLCHPFVIGEVSMGVVARRQEVLDELGFLGRATIANDTEVIQFVTRHKLFGIGIGYVDAHLLVSTQLTAGALLWTRDKRLFAASEKLGLAMLGPHKRVN